MDNNLYISLFELPEAPLAQRPVYVQMYAYVQIWPLLLSGANGTTQMA